MLAGVLASAGAFLTLGLFGVFNLGYDCTGFLSCDISRPNLAIHYYSVLVPVVAFAGSIISNSKARLGGMILIATAATAIPATIIIFLPFAQYGIGLAFAIFVAYISWIALSFYAGYLSLKGRKSRQQDRRVWDPDLEPLEADLST
jgi:hypothetical protein